MQNAAIPLGLGGVFVNLVTTATSTSEPGDFATGPWLNLFWGGTKIASTDILRPSVITGTAFAEQVLNRANGDFLLPADSFAADYNGSETHIGPALNQFQLGAAGYIGFQFDLAGNTRYGWMQVIPNNASTGTVVDWAYNSVPDEGIVIGELTAAPEPSRAVLLLGGLCAALLQRRRKT